MLFEILRQKLTDRRIDDALDLAVAQLGLGLALELRVGHPHAHHGREPLADVVTSRRQVLVDARLLTVGIDAAGQGRAEA